MDGIIQQPKTHTMKQPTPLWQVVSMFITVSIFAITGIISQSNKTSKLEEKVNFIQQQQQEIQSNADKKFDKIDTKIDLIQSDTRQILINLAGKVDRQ
jgi:hypothetical protein